jgi:hypothetical protein
MVKMLKLGKAAGPCNLCNATGMIELWDVEGEYEPCTACRGTGHSANNLIVIERETKKTKFRTQCDILEEAFYAWEMWDDDGSPLCDWADLFCGPGDYYSDVTPGIYLARMVINGDASKERAKPWIEQTFQHLLDHYNWKHDMGFKELSEIVAGGQYWSEAEES